MVQFWIKFASMLITESDMEDIGKVMWSARELLFRFDLETPVDVRTDTTTCAIVSISKSLFTT